MDTKEIIEANLRDMHRLNFPGVITEITCYRAPRADSWQGSVSVSVNGKRPYIYPYAVRPPRGWGQRIIIYRGVSRKLMAAEAMGDTCRVD